VIGFAQKKVDVFGHDHVSVHPQFETAARSLQTDWEEVINPRTVEEGLPPIASEGDEVRLSRFVETVQTARHGESVRLAAAYVCDVSGLAQKKGEPGAPRGF
jgi:hypothetical protein